MASQNCARCGQALPLSAFPVQRARPSGRGAYCRPCKREYARDWYRQNAKEQGRRVARNNAKYRDRNQAVVNALKDAPCQDCGGRFPAPVMEFDHVKPGKSANVSELVRRSASLAAVLAEIELCELVCANCHRMRTAQREGWEV